MKKSSSECDVRSVSSSVIWIKRIPGLVLGKQYTLVVYALTILT